MMRQGMWVVGVLLVGIVMGGCGESRVAECTTCGSPGLGDACLPELIPAGGFDLAGDVLLESSSVGCFTRICAVDGFTGDPTRSREQCAEEAGSTIECADVPSQAEIDQKIYCSCKCRDPNIDAEFWCRCGEGFECVELFEETSFSGGYCLRAGVDR